MSGDPNSQHIIDEKNAEIARLQKQLTGIINDVLQDDLDVRVVARAALAPIDVDGDSYAVPSLPDIARSLVAEIASLRLTDEEREAVEWYAGYGRDGLHAATLRKLLERLA